ncbi:MAG TPA: hypothetical protein VMM55_11180 [Thermohalobaculum sp.]|nr:hypothetical protein [Thermohalobaculum sp.]
MTARLAGALALAVALGGCAAVTVVDTAVGVTAKAVGTTVDVAAGAVDVVTPAGDDD